MSAGTDRANAAVSALGSAAADVVLKRHALGEAQDVLTAAQIEVDAAITDLQAEKATIMDGTK